MTYNRIGIISGASQHLGSPAITSENESKFAQQASYFFDLVYEGDISQSDYTFATRWMPLSLTTETPVPPYWQYAYQLPSDYIKAVTIWPGVEFDIVNNNTLLANIKGIEMKYVFLPRPEYLPAYYVTYLEYEIAHRLALSTKLGAEIIDRMKKYADDAKNYAMSINSQTRPNNAFRNSRWTTYRTTYASAYPYLKSLL